MSPERVYLDWNASAPLRPQARAAVIAAMDATGNPSSVHAEGRAARAIVEQAREAVAKLTGAKPAEVVFTSGATEANAWVLRRAWRTLFYSRLEHASVTAPVLANPEEIVEIPVTGSGRIDLDALAAMLAARGNALVKAPGQALLAVQAANNETGVVQPLTEAVRIASAAGVLVHCDAVQAAGRRPLDFAGSGASYMTLSAHKIGGPRGVGALIVREGAPVSPLILGGGQERGRRSGTEAVTAIAGFGAAAAAARDEIAGFAALASLRDTLEAGLLAAAPTCQIIGREAERLENTTCVAVPGRSAETLIAALDLAGFAVSAGSACASGKVTTSPVLAAMGLTPEVARGAIRVSLGHSTGAQDIARFIAAWTTIARPAAQAA